MWLFVEQIISLGKLIKAKIVLKKKMWWQQGNMKYYCPDMWSSRTNQIMSSIEYWSGNYRYTLTTDTISFQSFYFLSIKSQFWKLMVICIGWSNSNFFLIRFNLIARIFGLVTWPDLSNSEGSTLKISKASWISPRL